MKNLERENSPEIETDLKGNLHFYSETGSEGGYWAFMDEKFMPKDPQGEKLWNYDGLHMLHNGDCLTIFDKEDPTKIVWQGIIDLTESTNFEEDVFGYWIHNTQKGTDKEHWGGWFIQENPAQLELGEESIKIAQKIRAKALEAS